MILASFVILAFALVRDGRLSKTFELPALLRGRAVFVLACFFNAATFAGAALCDLAGAQTSWLGVALPFASLGIPGTEHPLQSNVAAVAAIVETLILAFLALRLRDGTDARFECIVLGACATACAAIAVAIPVVRSDDAYLYVGYTLLDHPAALQRVPFPAADRSVSALWGYPILPTLYGPLWIVLAKFVTAPFASVLARLYVFRIVGLFAVAGMTAACARLRDTRTALALVACNAALLGQYVLDAHNDGLGIALALFALVPGLAPALRVACVAAAGATKYTLLASGAVAFERFALAWRVAALAGAAALAVLAAYGSHLWTFGSVAKLVAAQNPLGTYGTIGHVLDQVAFAVIFAAAFVWRKHVRFGGAAFASLGVVPLPWYLGWGLPYQFVAGFERDYLVALPVLANLLDESYDVTPVREVLLLVTFAFAVAMAARIGPFRPLPEGEKPEG